MVKIVLACGLSGRSSLGAMLTDFTILSVLITFLPVFIRAERSEASLKFFKFAIFIKNRPYERRKSIDRILGYLKVSILISDTT